MAMLAEPKRSKSFALQPRGKPLYEDSNSFGSKMLSKMGWEPGKGLGAKEDGKLDFIKVKYKNDIQGIGFEARDDQWTQHEDGFNKLLQTLSTSNSQENSDEEESRPMMGFGAASTEKKESKIEYKPSGESLEEKSKTSRARVHYKKFTRGKDLSQYSEKDLANIFGKKVFDNGEVASSKTPPSEDSQPDENTFTSSIYTTTSTLSLSDYFKQKMMNKNNLQNVEPVVQEENEKPKKKKSKKKVLEEQEEEVFEPVEEEERPKRKKKKNKNVEETPEVEVVEEVVIHEVEIKSKKKKQKETPIEETESIHELQPVIEPETQTRKKKKRKDKKDEEPTPDPEPMVEISHNIDDLEKKVKKKRKNQDVNDEEEVVVKKKKKKSKSGDAVEEPSVPEPAAVHKPPKSLKQCEIDFNRKRSYQICTYLKNCQKLLARTTLVMHPLTAEIIRNANIADFRNSNISKIVGYGLTMDVGIDVMKDVKLDLGKMLKEKTVTGIDLKLLTF